MPLNPEMPVLPNQDPYLTKGLYLASSLERPELFNKMYFRSDTLDERHQNAEKLLIREVLRQPNLTKLISDWVSEQQLDPDRVNKITSNLLTNIDRADFYLSPLPFANTRLDLLGDKDKFKRYNRTATKISFGEAILYFYRQPADLMSEAQNAIKENPQNLIIPPLGILHYPYKVTGINLPLATLSGEAFHLFCFWLKHSISPKGTHSYRVATLIQPIQIWDIESLEALRLKDQQQDRAMHKLLALRQQGIGHPILTPFETSPDR